jgi:hypothetical protein
MARQPTAAINGLRKAASAIHQVMETTRRVKRMRPGARRAAWVVHVIVSVASGATEGSPLTREGEGAATTDGDGGEACIL